MKIFKEIVPKSFTGNLFNMIGNDWMLITTEHHEKVNSMTASCGGFGNLYPYDDVAFIFIRPQHYTNELLQQADTFSLNFFDEIYHKQLSYFGSISGRKEDKISKSGLTILHTDNTPFYEEAKTVFICRKIGILPTSESTLLNYEVTKKIYPNKDYHIMYMGKIEKLLVSSEN